MKSLSVYSSETGNKRKLAEALFEVLTDEKKICAIEEAPDPDPFRMQGSSGPTAARAKLIPSFWRWQNQNLSHPSGLAMRRQPRDILMGLIWRD